MTAKTNNKPSKVNTLQRLLLRLDAFQQRHSWLAFIFAIQKKYSDDNASNQSALITYYGFLSLFPLLLVLISIVQLLFNASTQWQAKVIGGVSKYFPIVGNQLQTNLHSPHKTGLALVASLLITLYGARGGADAFRSALDHLWLVPKVKRLSFPKSVWASLKIIVVVGLGLISATLLSSLATSLGRSFAFRLLSIVISSAVLYLTFLLVFSWAVSSKHVKYRDVRWSALLAAIGVELLQLLGGFIITHELKQLSSAYGAFAFVLGLLFLIYLHVEVILYAVEVDIVRKLKLWPRSLTTKLMTPEDEEAYKLYARNAQLLPNPPEEINVRFRREQ